MWLLQAPSALAAIIGPGFTRLRCHRRPAPDVPPRCLHARPVRSHHWLPIASAANTPPVAVPARCCAQDPPEKTKSPRRFPPASPACSASPSPQSFWREPAQHSPFCRHDWVLPGGGRRDTRLSRVDEKAESPLQLEVAPKAETIGVLLTGTLSRSQHTDVSDPVFAFLAMGKGIAVEPMMARRSRPSTAP